MLRQLWNDERGAVVTAELALLGTVGVLGGVVGLNMMARAVNEELSDAAFAFRSLDQSYHVQGFVGCGAYVAGSGYVQQDVAVSLVELCGIDDVEPGEHPGGVHGGAVDGDCSKSHLAPRLVPEKHDAHPKHEAHPKDGKPGKKKPRGAKGDKTSLEEFETDRVPTQPQV